MKTTLYLIRHAKSIGNERNLFYGITDYELCEEGIKQAEDLSIKLSNTNIDKIYSSPLKRCIQTITPTAEKHNLKVNIVENLKEIDLGSWENIPVLEINSKYPELTKQIKETQYYKGIEGQEDTKDVAQRVYNEILKIVKNNAGKSIIIASHMVALRSFLCKIQNIPFEKTKEKIGDLSNAGITTVVYNNDKDTFDVIKIAN